MEVEMSLQKKLAQKFQFKKKLEPSEVEKVVNFGDFPDFKWFSLVNLLRITKENH